MAFISTRLVFEVEVHAPYVEAGEVITDKNNNINIYYTLIVQLFEGLLVFEVEVHTLYVEVGEVFEQFKTRHPQLRLLYSQTLYVHLLQQSATQKKKKLTALPSGIKEASNHSVAPPKPLSGHNFRGFREASEWLP